MFLLAILFNPLTGHIMTYLVTLLLLNIWISNNDEILKASSQGRIVLIEIISCDGLLPWRDTWKCGDFIHGA